MPRPAPRSNGGQDHGGSAHDAEPAQHHADDLIVRNAIHELEHGFVSRGVLSDDTVAAMRE
jgi:hypothetical protein